MNEFGQFIVLRGVAGGATREDAIMLSGSHDVLHVTQNKCGNGYTAFAFVPSLTYRTPAENQARLARGRAKMARRGR